MTLPRHLIVCAGQLVHTRESLGQGTLGLLAQDGRLRVFGLTVGTVVPPGRSALLSQEGGWGVFGPAKRLDNSTGADTIESGALLVSLELSQRVRVHASLSGVAEAYPTRPLNLVLGKRLVVSTSRGVRRAGILRQIGLQAILTGPDGTERRYSGLAELAFSAELPKLIPGDAGALVLTDDSAPVGLVVGASHSGILITPMHELLHAAGLSPLSSWAAQHHNAIARGPRDEERPSQVAVLGPRTPYGQSDPLPSSEEILEASDLEELLDAIDESLPT